MGLIEGAGPQDLASDLLIARNLSEEMKVAHARIWQGRCLISQLVFLWMVLHDLSSVGGRVMDSKVR